MERHVEHYCLWILCVDDEVHDVLSRLALSKVCLLKLSQLETEELLSVKQSRTIGEYCWTLTPFAPRFVFEADNSVERVTYLDADLWFLKSPKRILDEFDASGKYVLITDHAYSPEYDRSSCCGQYCVQFMIFCRIGGECVRKWWEERCLEWCYDRQEDGKFGDQKYLDDWPDRFGEFVHVLRDFHLALAPWNASRFPYGGAIFFHFHGLRIISQYKVDIGSYYLPLALHEYVYRPYLRDIRSAVVELKTFGFAPTRQGRQRGLLSGRLSILLRLRVLLRQLFAESHLRY